ncbi:peptide transporter [Thermococcus sibiricus]|uniref:dolichyl-phosphooligosaccharide-protein glycotransferase n=1 Tax=Thermococcus sibiricus (strain DSM 12597 / MM 739) TaxID=604354 RepID=C6A1I9_THESM|nr:peptide transporter [Thermococcus sibiricus]ACS89484.1 Oligosaccharyl transferase STT3 subunit superfamily [Thermococcus sibiricus MM 739]
MVGTKAKEKNKEKSISSFDFSKIRVYILPLTVILIAIIGYKIRAATGQTRYFIDPDTFYHFEIYKQAVQEWVPKYYPLADAPFGSLIGEPLGLYIIPALLYRFLSVLGLEAIEVFKMWPPIVGFFSIIGAYFLGRKLHSDWAGIWAALVMMFSVAHWTRTFSGNARGDGPFLMFFLYAVLFMFYYLEINEIKRKAVFGSLFVISGVLMLSVWNGSPFGLMVLLGFASLYAVGTFIFGKVEDVKKFAKEFYPSYLAILLIGYALTSSGIVKVGGHIRFAFEVFLGLALLTLIMLYGGKYLNYSDKTHRFGVVAVVVLLGFTGAYLYVGPKLFSLMSGAYQSTQVYETVQELAKTTWEDVKRYYSVRGTDGLLFLLSLLGIAIVIFRFLKALSQNKVDAKNLFLLVFYGLSVYLMWTAVRFLFLASGAVLLTFGIFVGELFGIVEAMQEKVSTKALYATLLILLFIPIPIVGANTTYNSAKVSGEAVTPSWEETLKWLRESTNEYDTATSWWDYGYWIESSLLGNRRASADGGHARDRDYIIARFLANDGNHSEVDFESWQLNYFIAWIQDWAKFNAISYLGGAITRYERDNRGMILPFDQKIGENSYYSRYAGIQFHIIEQEGKKIGVIVAGNQQGEPVQTINMQTGEVIPGSGNFPYVVYAFSNYAVAVYYKVATSNFLKLAFGIPISSEAEFSGKLRSNFRIVKSTGDLSTYEFVPFGLYRIEIYENNTWKSVSKLIPGNYKARLYISAFGRDVKDAVIKLRAYDGDRIVSEQVIAQNVNINHLNEIPIEVSLEVPNATRYQLVLIQEGPVGALTEAPKLNGNLVSPIRILNDGQSGELELKAGFRRDYSKMDLYLRATVIYLVRTQGENRDDPKAAFEPHMDIIHYEKVAGGLSTTNKELYFKGQVSFPEVIQPYIEKLNGEYGDKVEVRGIRVEPVFIADKEYILYEG